MLTCRLQLLWASWFSRKCWKIVVSQTGDKSIKFFFEHWNMKTDLLTNGSLVFTRLTILTESSSSSGTSSGIGGRVGSKSLWATASWTDRRLCEEDRSTVSARHWGVSLNQILAAVNRCGTGASILKCISLCMENMAQSKALQHTPNQMDIGMLAVKMLLDSAKWTHSRVITAKVSTWRHAVELLSLQIYQHTFSSVDRLEKLLNVAEGLKNGSTCNQSLTTN